MHKEVEERLWRLENPPTHKIGDMFECKLSKAEGDPKPKNKRILVEITDGSYNIFGTKIRRWNYSVWVNSEKTLYKL